MFPEPSVTTTSRLSRLSMAMLPEPALSVTLRPDSAPPVMFPDPFCRLTVPVSPFTCTSPDPDPTVTGPVRPCRVRLPEPSERTARLPAGRTAWKLNAQMPTKKWHCGDTITPDGVLCQVTLERNSEYRAFPVSWSVLPAAWVTCTSAWPTERLTVLPCTGTASCTG